MGITSWFGALAWLLLLPAAPFDEPPGHSRHGSAFDTGLRQRPWRMEGIGHTHFPVTTADPEVQVWFDQGNTLLHSFWFEEAERSFRWCVKLDPNCAMAYWGLARTSLNWFTDPTADTPENKRGRDFLREAVRRKASVTPRERMYIEAWEAGFTGDSKGRHALVLALQDLVLAFPDDVEARALYALYALDGGNAFAIEQVLAEVLAQEPDHPGAHHYRIHSWDDVGPAQALESCRRYGAVAPAIGHSNHMPGHNYSKLGMWHEAAISMDAATRVELRYMSERLALPFETWNYPHNRNYLCGIQEHLGMELASLAGARALIAAPRDPDRNKDGGYGAIEQGMQALVRCMITFERWDDILEPGRIPWRDTAIDKGNRAVAETLALIGQQNLVDARARLAELRVAAAAQLPEDKYLNMDLSLAGDAAEGLLCAAEGDILEATRLLTQAAAAEQKKRDHLEYINDPSPYPWPVHRVLGDVFLQHGEPRLALQAYERALENEPNDAFTLSGLARAHAALGEKDAARGAAGRLAAVWASADPGLRWQAAVDALGLDAAPAAQTPAPERRYTLDLQAELGPVNWEAFAAPSLDVLDDNGLRVTLEDFKGRNVLLVFYLGEECAHCVEQLVAINGHTADWAAENTVVLAVSSASPEKNRKSMKLGELSMQLLSDIDHASARRFTSYDDFEDIELHSTVLIDGKGRVHWKRTGGDPFTDMDFLLQEVKRMNQPDAAAVAGP